MSRSGRKRKSKWDLKEVPQLSPGDMHNDSGPRNAGKSRSRTPQHDFELDSSFEERNIVAQPCKDFGAGRCKRDDHCPYFHPDVKDSENRRYPEGGLTDSLEGRSRRFSGSKDFSYDDARAHPLQTGRYENICNEFLKGRCLRGASCKYDHHHSAASNGIGKWSAYEIFKEREINRERGDSFNTSSKFESRRSGDIPCKFFAAGHCRNGKSCRFSHQGQTHDSPDDRSRDEWRLPSNNINNVGHVREGLKWSHRTVSEDAELPEWNGDGIGVSESLSAENWVGDMEISPTWNSSVPSSNHMVMGEPGYMTQTSQSLIHNVPALQSVQQDMSREECQKHHTFLAIQPLRSHNSGFQSNPRLREDTVGALACKDRNSTGDTCLSGNDLNISVTVPQQSLNMIGQGLLLTSHPLSGSSAFGQSQQTYPLQAARPEIINPQNQHVFQENTSVTKPDFGDLSRSELITQTPCSQQIVSTEQLSELSSLSASLARYLGTGQLYAALNGSISIEGMPSSISSYAGPVASSYKLNPSIGSTRQYDPLSDSIESIKPDIDKLPPGFAPISVKERSISDEKQEIMSQNFLPPSLASGASDGDMGRSGNLEAEPPSNKRHQVNELGPVGNNKEDENGGAVAEHSKEGQDDGPLEKIDGDGQAEESKKNNDAKGIRAFKFALAEFVKELLKPTYKDSQISKDAFKTIVKKVVDKVIGSVQGANIPQSQEKIDNYLSSSKQKLSKLVQAYVEKLKKTSVA
ncbi:hypothetical protein RJ639_013399 [Escallonia herrerae]|uniref:C3H1-type domain-containing protein n=1 Tax=Escallonia herrerae TaxID=1293975 RepID=A0AA89AM10_9ASTE|nr:hypothetical protein RJ639_013399 [Escallonia herrerae]